MIKTVSLETAKALKEAGFPQIDTGYYFRKYWRITSAGSEPWYGLNNKHDMTELDFGYSYAAPTSDEILEELPETIQLKERQTWWLTIQKCNGIYCCFYEDDGYEDKFYQENESLPEALAQMWIYLKKEGLLTPKVKEGYE